jgi:hypothetical protein
MREEICCRKNAAKSDTSPSNLLPTIISSPSPQTLPNSLRQIPLLHYNNTTYHHHSNSQQQTTTHLPSITSSSPPTTTSPNQPTAFHTPSTILNNNNKPHITNNKQQQPNQQQFGSIPTYTKQTQPDIPMPPKSKPTPTGASKPQDDRFSSLLKQPRFKTPKAAPKKSALQKDDRFKDVFDDEDFGIKTLDKYQRLDKKGAKEGLSSLYATEEEDEEEQQPTPTATKSTQLGPKSKLTTTPLVPTPSAKAAAGPTKRRMPAQAQMDSESDEDEPVTNTTPDFDNSDVEDEDQESSTDIGTTDDEDLDDHDELGSDDEGEELPEGYMYGTLPGSYAPIIENPTRRLALYNMEWDQLKAVDILAIFRSLCPLGGKINNVSVFPSEKGKIMLEREKNGDFTLWTDPKMDELAKQVKENKLKKKQALMGEDGGKKNKRSTKAAQSKQADIELSDSDEYLSDGEIDKILFGNDEDDKKVIEANRNKLKDYEMQKLSYYYAILDCDTVDTAVKLYNEADGLEYESSGNVFDLRFVPDQHKFDEKTLRDRATVVPPGHRPPVYQTNVLNSTNVECTWEKEDPQRHKFLTQDFSQKDYRVDDLTAFLANESDEEGFATDVPISETDDDSDAVDSDDKDSDDDDKDSDDDDRGKGYISSGAPKIRTDTLGRDRIASTKVVDGKKKNVLLLKRRARNDFADILAEIKSDSKEVKSKKDKKDIIDKANKALGSDDEDGDEMGDDDEEDGDEKDDFGSDWSDEDEELSTNEAAMTDSDDEEQADAFRRKLAQAKKAKDDEKKDKRIKKPLIVLQSALDRTALNPKSKINAAKETTKSLNKEYFRNSRLDEWQQQYAEATTKGGKKAQQPKQQPPISINKDAIEDTKKFQLKQKNTKLASIEGSIYDDDVLDDDDFFKNAAEYFPESEFGQVDFKDAKGGAKPGTKAKHTEMDNSDDEADAAVKRKLEESKRKRKTPKQSMDDASDSDDNEGYNLQELVARQKIKQVAIQNKKKSAKELENELIEQSLGADAYTTTDPTNLTLLGCFHLSSLLFGTTTLGFSQDFTCPFSVVKEGRGGINPEISIVKDPSKTVIVNVDLE